MNQSGAEALKQLLKDFEGTEIPIQICQWITANLFPVLARLLKREANAYRALVLLIAATIVGTDEFDLVTYTGYPLQFVTEIKQRLHSAGIWSAEGHEYQWETEQSVFDDVLVSLGVVRREQLSYIVCEHSPKDLSGTGLPPDFVERYLQKLGERHGVAMA